MYTIYLDYNYNSPYAAFLNKEDLISYLKSTNIAKYRIGIFRSWEEGAINRREKIFVMDLIK